MDNFPEYACGFGIEEGAIRFPLCLEREARLKYEAIAKQDFVSIVQLQSVLEAFALYATHAAECHFNEMGHPESHLCNCGLDDLWGRYEQVCSILGVVK
jgi:hypothetical protein